VTDQDQASKVAERIGYPVIIKAVEGGGGRGLRIAGSREELVNLFLLSKNESKISFGSDRLYLEKYLANPKHIEVQILADYDSTVHLGERECSIQRRYQKLIEETPSPTLTKETRDEMTETAIKIINEIGYNNAGTVEFLYKDGRFYFMEINARIQVEHPITEEVTGIDIVEQQIHIATGDGLTIKQEDINPKGHAIECRINAENPITFAPYPGKIDQFIPPIGEGIRVDTALYEGYSIPVFYDSLIAKLVCLGHCRDEAIDRMKKSLLSFRISGIPSTISFHQSAMNDIEFLTGKYDTSFINKMKQFSPRNGEIAAAIFSLLPRRIQFIKSQELRDAWIQPILDLNETSYLNDNWRWST
jgi:acetyl/propionyl-CoA carboxylase alpha subunit